MHCIAYVLGLASYTSHFLLLCSLAYFTRLRITLLLTPIILGYSFTCTHVFGLAFSLYFTDRSIESVITYYYALYASSCSLVMQCQTTKAEGVKAYYSIAFEQRDVKRDVKKDVSQSRDPLPRADRGYIWSQSTNFRPSD